MRASRPPRFARWLLGRLLPDDYREAVLGDLAEGFTARVSESGSTRRARAWYWSQVIHSDVVRLRREARRERALRGGEADVSDVWIQEMKQALRVFRRSPGYVGAVVLTLSVGIGGATSIFNLVNGLLLRPMPGIEVPDRLASIRTSEYGSAFGVSSYMDYLDFAERARSFELLAAHKPRLVDAAGTGATESIGAAMVTSTYFDVLGVRPLVGRTFGREVDESGADRPEAVLTYGLWQRWFGEDPAVVGRDIVLNGRPFTVVGVTPQGFRGTSLVDVPEVFVPMSMQPHLMPGSGYLLDRRGWGGVSMIGRLADGVPSATAAAEIVAIGAALSVEYPATNAERRYAVVGLREASLPGGSRADIVRLSVLLMSVVSGLWLVVCLNVANLFLARSLRRRPELAVRLALGAARSRVVGQLVLEFMILAVLAGAAGAALAAGAAGTISRLPLPMLLDTSMDVRSIAFVGGLALLSALVCALVPAVAASGLDTRSTAAPAQSSGPRGRRWPSRLLIMGQVTLSVVLLFTTGLFARTFENLSSTDPGFDPTDILTARVDPSLQGYGPEEIADFYGRLTEAAAAIPGVTAVALADGLPGPGNFGSDGWFFEGASEPEQPSRFFSSTVSTNYFGTLRIPVIEGRDFDDGDAPGRLPVLVVNEAGARLIEARTGRSAVGQRMGMEGPGGPFLEVVGVVSDSRTGRGPDALPFVYAAHTQVLPFGGGARMAVMLKSSLAPESLAAELRDVMTVVDPNVSVTRVVTLERFLDDLLAPDRLTVTVLGLSSALALLLVAVGVYGLLTYLVAQRTRELGVRLALGASHRGLRAVVVREVTLLAGMGLTLGVGGALFVTRLTESFLVGVAPTDPASLGLGILTVLGVTLAAAYVPASHATRVDPLVAMRAD